MRNLTRSSSTSEIAKTQGLFYSKALISVAKILGVPHLRNPWQSVQRADRGAHLQDGILLVLEVPISRAIAVAIKTGS
ncbi:hypothetical protein [Oscillatoria acuminata]|uniref:hypothetical protein n=1 Tax=Oscillatoria acuminata TaxID=118323 RepID=UPI0002FD758C|nr:hypothetical protein [Oscillatoria acuminata]